jgi:hypothetical protein
MRNKTNNNNDFNLTFDPSHVSSFAPVYVVTRELLLWFRHRAFARASKYGIKRNIIFHDNTNRVLKLGKLRDIVLCYAIRRRGLFDVRH